MSYILILRINVIEKTFYHMGNQTQDSGTKCLAHRCRMLYRYTKSLSKKTKFIKWLPLIPPRYQVVTPLSKQGYIVSI